MCLDVRLTLDLNCSKKFLFKKTQIGKKQRDIKIKYKKEMEVVIDNASVFMH